MTAPTHAERVSVLAVVTEGLNNQRKLTTSRVVGRMGRGLRTVERRPGVIRTICLADGPG